MNPLGVDKVLVLCLDKRIDIWTDLEYDLKKRKWDHELIIAGNPGANHNYDVIKDRNYKYSIYDTDEFPPVYSQSIQYPSWWARPNAYNAWKTHNYMLKLSLERKYESVLFLEDDILITENYDKQEDLIKGFSKHNIWDMFYLGSFLNVESNNSYDVVPLYGNAGGWHAVALKKDVIKKLIQFPPLGPYDWMCQKFIQINSNYLCYAANPCFIRQRGAFSYVEGHYLGRREEDNYQ